MASTYSPSLRLELMATGDQSGTWGDTTNTNLGTLLEQAITGFLSVAQGDVANLTLTALDGASDQSRNMIVELTGAMTAGRNVVVPTAEKLYLIKNSTSGGFAITVKTLAGTGPTVPAGTARWVYCDGTNVVDGQSGPWSPSSNDAQALGFSGTAWADLFLASGGVINWNAGDVTITHSANTLAFAGASSGYTFDALISGTTAAFTGTVTSTGSSVGFVGFQAVSTQADAAAGPIVDLYRNSATPAANDVLGQLLFTGEDSAGNTQEYASIEAVITDATSTSEDGVLDVYTVGAGTRTKRVSVGLGVTIGAATGGDQGAGTLNATALYQNGTALNPGVLGTPVASTSGTEVLFTGIPSWATQITMSISGLSTTGTAVPLIQIGDSGGPETTGYLGAASLVAGGVASANFTTGLGLTGNTGAWLSTTVFHGEVQFNLLDSSTFTWGIRFVGAASDLAQTFQGASSKSLSAALDRVRLVTTDAFDAGKVNIIYR